MLTRNRVNSTSTVFILASKKLQSIRKAKQISFNITNTNNKIKKSLNVLKLIKSQKYMNVLKSEYYLRQTNIVFNLACFMQLHIRIPYFCTSSKLYQLILLEWYEVICMCVIHDFVGCFILARNSHLPPAHRVNLQTKIGQKKCTFQLLVNFNNVIIPSSVTSWPFPPNKKHFVLVKFLNFGN